MRKLILIKHAMPVLRDGVPPAHWELSEEGRHATVSLAKELAVFPIVAVLTSTEPKARETARVLADQRACARG